MRGERLRLFPFLRELLVAEGLRELRLLVRVGEYRQVPRKSLYSCGCGCGYGWYFDCGWHFGSWESCGFCCCECSSLRASFLHLGKRSFLSCRKGGYRRSRALCGAERELYLLIASLLTATKKECEAKHMHYMSQAVLLVRTANNLLQDQGTGRFTGGAHINLVKYALYSKGMKTG